MSVRPPLAAAGAPPGPPSGQALVDECAERALALLRRNLTTHGVLAATPTAAAIRRAYTRIFGRDAGICALAMIESGDAGLQRGAVASLDALAAQQAANGQIPKYVDPDGADADFWYLGCVDATLWWLIAARHAARRLPARGLDRRWRVATRRALAWLACQEHQKFFLLQQNEASDWADIMPRSGFVLYTNALWYHVKRLFGLPEIEATRHHFNHLFYPFSRDLPEYRRARLLMHFARREAANRGLYLSFVNFSFFGDEGDVFGNLLAVLCGLADGAMARQIVRALECARAADPYPVRSVCHPIPPGHSLWRRYMGRHRQNLEHQYHNGGVWPFVGGFWVMALAGLGMGRRAAYDLERLARANSLDDWRFTEWFHGRTLEPMGMPGQSWNAAAFLLARAAVRRGSGR